MKVSECILFLQDCLSACESKESAKDLFCITYGNRPVAEYSSNDITSFVDSKKTNNPKTRFVIKFMKHNDLIVAWPKNSVSWDGKYRVYKSQLLDALNNPSRIHDVSLENGRTFIFSRKRELGIEFITNYVLQREATHA